MVGETTEWVEGSLRAKSWELAVGGVVEDLTTATLAIKLTSAAGVTVDLSARCAVVAPATSGLVSFTPQTGDLVASASPYRVTWFVTKATVPQAFPEKDPLIWHVRPV